MIAFEMNSKALGGLRVTVLANCNEVEEIRFASSGNLLPRSMEQKFRACADDLYRVGDEVWSNEYEGY